ncbi:MAG: ABC transporter permease [Armatimonadota bacterium]|nr:ABC transporter permease [Armatimonadota bacterium]MDW8156135.1 ABC transporter permease [Armatimonadota bacterium]
MAWTVVARWDARAASRDRWLWALAAAFGTMTLAAAALALTGLRVVGLSSFDRAAAALAHLSMLFVPLMGLVLGSLWIAGDRETGALDFLLAQPVHRWALYTGRYLGLAGVVVGATWAGYGAAGVVLAWGAGTEHLPSFLWLVFLSTLLALASLSLGLAISATSPNRGRALGAALLTWLGLTVLTDLGVLASAVALRLPPAVLLALACANPTSAFRIAGLAVVTRSPELLGPAGLVATDRLGAVGTALALCAVLLAWAVGGLAVGVLRFRRAVGP